MEIDCTWTEKKYIFQCCICRKTKEYDHNIEIDGVPTRDTVGGKLNPEGWRKFGNMGWYVCPDHKIVIDNKEIQRGEYL